MTTIEISPCVSIETAASRLGVSRKTVERLLRDGELPAVRPHRRCTLIPASAVEEYVRQAGAEK